MHFFTVSIPTSDTFYVFYYFLWYYIILYYRLGLKSCNGKGIVNKTRLKERDDLPQNSEDTHNNINMYQHQVYIKGRKSGKKVQNLYLGAKAKFRTFTFSTPTTAGHVTSTTCVSETKKPNIYHTNRLCKSFWKFWKTENKNSSNYLDISP